MITEIKMKTLTQKKHWNSDDVRRACIHNGWYTRGDNKAYYEMLEYVDTHEPTKENVYIVAMDINEHSRSNTVSNIMYCLEEDAIYTTYYLDGEEEF